MSGASGASEPLTILVSTRAVITTDDDGLLLTPATISLSAESGKIVAIVPAVLPRSSFPVGSVYIDYGSMLLMPGLVDAHVHLNEPGRTEWEGFESGTRAAAAGGVTTVVDMPLNAIPPTTTLQAFGEKLAASQGQCWVDVAFYGGIVPGNAAELLPLVEAGVRGFKGFMIESGVAEFPAVSSTDIALAMETLKATPTTVMFHAEMIPPITDSVGDSVGGSDRPLAPHGALTSYQTFLESRPPMFETCAIAEIISLAQLAPSLHLHIVHLSATEAVPLLKAARRAGVHITAETCFHYLALAAEDVDDGDCRYKCCPPIRDRANQDGLWEELLAPDSCISTVVSDHSPCTPELKLLPPGLPGSIHHSDSGVDMSADLARAAKDDDGSRRGDFFAAWGGISSVGLGLPILHTAAQARRRRGASAPTVVHMVRLCCAATAAQVGLGHRKGALKVGLDADIAVFDDADDWVLESGAMHWRNKCSPWDRARFRGRVKQTWLRGRSIYELGAANRGFGAGLPTGRPIVERRTA